MNGVEVMDQVRFVPSYLAWMEQGAAQLELGAPEKAWLEAAQQLLVEGLAGAQSALEPARDLPEHGDLRAEWLARKQEGWADALERLHAGVVFHAGNRAPLLESLFPHVKLAALRRTRLEVAQSYWTEFVRRVQSSYVQRQLTHEAYVPLLPSVEEVQARWDEWAQSQEMPLLENDAAEQVRGNVSAAGERLERKLTQARHLVEAAFLGADDGVHVLQTAPRPRRRARPVAPTDAAPAPEP